MKGILELNGHKDVLTVMLIIQQEGRTYIRDLINRGLNQNSCYKALKILLELGLAKHAIVEEPGKGGIKKVYWLTDEGLKIADHVAAIDHLAENAAHRKEKEEARKTKAPG